MKLVLLFTLFFGLFLDSRLNAEMKYKIQDLGTLQSEESTAVAINDTGQVAGYYRWKGAKYTFFWDPNEGLMVLNTPKEDSFEISHFYNNTAMIWGISRNVKSNLITGKARWERSGGYLVFPLPRFKPGNSLMEILGLSKDLSLIGIYKNQSGQEFYFQGSSDASNLPIIYGDLGLPAKITSIVGSAYWQDNQSHTIVVANCLCPVVNKGEIATYVEKVIFWRTDQGWKVNRVFSSENYNSDKALGMNNNGEVICETDNGWILVDLKKGDSKELRKFDSVRFFNDKGFFITDKMDLVETVFADGEVGKLHLNFSDPNIYINFTDGIWKRILAVNAINNAGYVIGEAETIFGEVHAVLLVPMK